MLNSGCVAVTGSFRVFVLFDVCEEIDLEDLRKILGSGPPRREPSFKHPAPDYVRFERAPVIQNCDPLILSNGEQFQCRIKYFDYGVISVELQTDFSSDWDDLVRASSRRIEAPEIESLAESLIREQVSRVVAALDQPYSGEWISEDYYIIQLREADGLTSGLSSEDLLQRHGRQIAQIVRGDSQPLSTSECREALQSSMSYYPNDLLVVGWVAALVYDTPEGAAPAIQLLEYANTQLLEFRHYDEILTRVLGHVYKSLERRGSFFHRWGLAREAERLNTILLDVRELSERTDNAIKFLSDMFYARTYRVAAEKIGVTDYRNLVEEKLKTAGELYQFMVGEFHQARAFVLEVMVVAILVIELVHLFRGSGS
jgi:hypothetical protein